MDSQRRERRLDVIFESDSTDNEEVLDDFFKGENVEDEKKKIKKLIVLGKFGNEFPFIYKVITRATAEGNETAADDSKIIDECIRIIFSSADEKIIDENCKKIKEVIESYTTDPDRIKEYIHERTMDMREKG